GASGDYSPLHIDDDFAKSAGYGGVFAHGGIALGFATEAVGKWLENGRVVTTHAKFQRLVWPGDILTAKGVVVDRHEHAGEPRIEVDVWAENQNHDIVMKGQVTCALWPSEKEEKKGKGLWPPAQPKSAETLRAERAASEAARAAADAEDAAREAQNASRSADAPVPKPSKAAAAKAAAAKKALAAKKPAAPAPSKAPAAAKAAKAAPVKKAAPAKKAAAAKKAAPAKAKAQPAAAKPKAKPTAAKAKGKAKAKKR
ncbi:MAG: MaoC/PaaZ C-terminal domain-containing protein, partial [Myxococcota bacterium]